MGTCKLCALKINDFQTVKDAKTGEELDVGFCLSCGFVQLRKIPDGTELKVYYSHNYRKDYKKVYAPKLKYVYRAGKAAVERLNILQQIVNNPSKLKLLDIGAGGGEFVYQATRAGFNARGIEPSIGYSEYARNEYGVSVDSIMLDELKEGAADVVTLFHVLEHLAKPEYAMKKIYDILNPDGYLFIEVPNILQNDSSPHNIYFKAHLFYYSMETLIAVASRYFDVLYVNDVGNIKAIFKKRTYPLESMQLPSQESVIKAKIRLKHKGWIEYIFIGGGYKKPFKKLSQMLLERNLPAVSAKELLDSMPLRFIKESV